jgi:hypothetical protein
MLYIKYDRFDFMIVLASVGSILSLVSATSVTLTRYFTHSFSDKSMMEKLYSVDKELKEEEEDPLQ